MSCGVGVGRRCSSDPALLWLWCRPEATAPIRPLAWEPPYAAGAAQRNSKKTKKKKKKEKAQGEFLLWLSGLRIRLGSSHCGAAEMNLTRIHEVAGLIPGLIQWVKDPAWRGCGVGHLLQLRLDP